MLPALRKEAGLTQADLGAIIGKTHQAISNIELGAIPKADTLRHIADVLADRLSRPVGDILRDLTNQYSEAES